MNFFQLPNGEGAGYDDPTQAPAGAQPISAEQFAQIATALTLAQAQSKQAQTLSDACHAAIVSGFQSSALGAPHAYPSDVQTQANQTAVATSPTGGGLWCSASTAALTAHTQQQGAQVVTDFVAWLNKCQSHLATLIAQVNMATTPTAAQAIAWTNPV